MNKRVVTLKDEVAELELGVLTAKEMDLLFTIFMCIITSAEDENKLNLSELMRRANLKLSRTRINDMLSKFHDKLQNMKRVIFNDATKNIDFVPFPIFDVFRWDLDDDFLLCKVCADKLFLFGDKGYFGKMGKGHGGFIKFDLDNFIFLKHKHSKQILLLSEYLKRYKYEDRQYIYLSDFRCRFNISDKIPYKQIKNSILNKAQKDLENIGTLLSVDVGKGFHNKVIKIYFITSESLKKRSLPDRLANSNSIPEYTTENAEDPVSYLESLNNTPDVNWEELVSSDEYHYSDTEDTSDYIPEGFQAIGDEDIPF